MKVFPADFALNGAGDKRFWPDESLRNRQAKNESRTP
jgi:hypothetical protein